MTTVIQFFGSLSDGGAETLVKDYGVLFHKYKETNIRCVLVALHNVQGTANLSRIQNSNVIIRYIYEGKMSWRISLLRKLFGRIYVPYKFYQIIKEFRPDAIHVHMGLLHFVKPLRNKIKCIRLFYTCHNEPRVYFSGTNSEEYDAAKALIRDNNLQIIGLHENMKVELNNLLGVSNSIVINNGIDITRFANVLESKNSIRSRLNIPKDAFLVGHIGRFFRQKNHEFLLDVFAEILKCNKDSWLLLVGSGPNMNSIINKAEKLGVNKRMTILSHRADIPELLKAMDVFLFPSLYEGLSVTLVEAQAAGKRCIISDTINPQSILSDKTIPISLKEPPSKWAEYVLDDTITNGQHGDLYDYDMKKVIVKLANLYKGKSI